MIKKLLAVLIATLLILPIGGITYVKINSTQKNEDIEKEDKEIKLREARWSDWKWENQLGFYIHTKYNGIEKNTPVIQSIFSGIDVDNDPMTGVDGKDVKVSIFALPLLQPTDEGLVFTLSLALKVIRLGDEIKNGELEICFGGSVPFNGLHIFKIGYYSADGEEIPKEIREVVTIVPYILYDRDPEFYLNVEPIFESGNENISAIIEYSHENFGEHTVTIDYFPAVNTMIKITPSIGINKFAFSIERFADVEQTIRMRYEGEFALNMTIEDIPQQMAFALNFAENYFEYEASDEFNASLILEYGGVEFLAKIEYLPHYLAASFNPEGYLDINIDERKTKFIVANDLENPTIYLSISNLSGEAIIRWDMNFDAIGFITVDGFKGIELEIKAELGSIYFRYYAVIQTEHFEIRWNLTIPGSIFIDSNNEWIASCSFNLSIDNIFGLLIEASLLKANNFKVEWQTESPIFNIDGELQFVGEITFAIMINGVWYHIFS